MTPIKSVEEREASKPARCNFPDIQRGDTFVIRIFGYHARLPRREGSKSMWRVQATLTDLGKFRVMDRKHQKFSVPPPGQFFPGSRLGGLGTLAHGQQLSTRGAVWGSRFGCSRDCASCPKKTQLTSHRRPPAHQYTLIPHSSSRLGRMFVLAGGQNYPQSLAL